VTLATTASVSDGSAGVLVVYEPTAAGRLALLHADSLATDRRVWLRVLVVVALEREDVGRARCRQSAVLCFRLAAGACCRASVPTGRNACGGRDRGAW
jgi:hypothetical protein